MKDTDHVEHLSSGFPDELLSENPILPIFTSLTGGTQGVLFDDERRVFERLSVFAGGCSLEAAEAVCAGDDVAPEDVVDLLAHLVDKSLVTVSQSGDVARFDLLQTLALYGRERLAATGERLYAGLYVAVSLTAGLGAAWVGIALTRVLLG